MNFASVLLLCLGAIALCASLVFLVETLVAFCGPEGEDFVRPTAAILDLPHELRQSSLDRAA